MALGAQRTWWAVGMGVLGFVCGTAPFLGTCPLRALVEKASPQPLLHFSSGTEAPLRSWTDRSLGRLPGPLSGVPPSWPHATLLALSLHVPSGAGGGQVARLWSTPLAQRRWA